MGMFRIGEFSKLPQVPVNTPRYYDEVDLFKPAVVDGTAGYRYYAAEQLAAIHRILALRDLGFSLHQIARILRANPSPEEPEGRCGSEKPSYRRISRRPDGGYAESLGASPSLVQAHFLCTRRW